MTGFWNKILKINLSTGKIEDMELEEKVFKEYLGGNGLGIYLLNRETDGRVEAFSEGNPLIFVSGALNGSKVPMTEKCGFYSKSPLTGIMAEGIFGGGIGEQLKQAGYDAVVIKGKSNKLSYITVGEDGINIRECTELEGLGTEKTEELLKKRHGGNAAVIGPAGENLV